MPPQTPPQRQLASRAEERPEASIYLACALLMLGIGQPLGALLLAVIGVNAYLHFDPLSQRYGRSAYAASLLAAVTHVINHPRPRP